MNSGGNLMLHIVTDNKLSDPVFVNILMKKYCPTELPLPHGRLTQKYGALWEIHSMQWMLVMMHDPQFIDKKRGFAKALSEIYDLPKCKKQHDHRAVNDAYTIGWELQIIFDILSGKISQKSEEGNKNKKRKVNNVATIINQN